MSAWFVIVIVFELEVFNEYNDIVACLQFHLAIKFKV